MEKIFGVGFSKTGTTSLEAALTLLGYKVCKGHWNNNYSNYLAALYKHQDYAEILNLVPYWDAFADLPWGGGDLYKTLYQHYPNAHFILTKRDPKRWYKSLENMLTTFDKNLETALDSYHAQHKFGAVLYFKHIFGIETLAGNEQKIIDYYVQHNQAVIDFFTQHKARFMVFELTEGDRWDKLCPFLGKAIPKDPFPQANMAHKPSVKTPLTPVHQALLTQQLTQAQTLLDTALTDTEPSAESYYLQAKIHYYNENWQGAYAAIQQVQDGYHPASSALLLAQIERVLQQHDNAITVLQQTLAKDEKSQPHLNALIGLYIQNQQIDKAYEALLQCLNINLVNPAVHNHLFALIPLLPDVARDELFSRLLPTLLKRSKFSLQPLAPWLLNWVLQHFHLEPSHLRPLARANLLVDLLSQVRLADPYLENALKVLRLELVNQILSTQNMDDALQGLLQAISLQLAQQDFLWTATAEERNLIDAIHADLQQQLRQPLLNPDGLVGNLLLMALYRPLHNIPNISRLLSIDPAKWPNNVRNVIQTLLKNPYLLAQKSIVATQMEQLPMPAVDIALSQPIKEPCGVMLSQLIPNFAPCDFKAKTLLIYHMDVETLIQTAHQFAALSITYVHSDANTLIYALDQLRKQSCNHVRCLDDIDKVSCFDVMYLSLPRDHRALEALLSQLMPQLTPHGLVHGCFSCSASEHTQWQALLNTLPQDACNDWQSYRSALVEAYLASPKAMQTLDYAPLCQISQLHRLESYRQQQGIEAQELQDSLQRYGLSYLHQTPRDFWANRGNVKS